MLTIVLPTTQKEPIMEDNQNNSIREAHFKEQIEAAAMQASVIHTTTMDALETLEYEAAYIGSIAAAIQVGRVGNIPLKVQEIFDHINS